MAQQPVDAFEAASYSVPGDANVVKVVPDNFPAETGNLNKAIDDHLGQGTYTIFELERDAVYWLEEGTIEVDDVLHLRAEEGEGHLPIIRPTTEGGAERILTSQGGFIMENIFLTMIRADGALNHGIVDEGNTDGNIVIIEGSVFAGTFGTSLFLQGSGYSTYINNSTFINAGRNHWDFGRFINTSNRQSKLWIENSSLYNFVHTILIGNSGYDELHLNHNTFVNTGSNIRIGDTQIANITNNLFYNLSLRGESSGIIAVTTTDNDASRSITIKNNNIGYYDETHSALFASDEDKAPKISSTLEEWIPDGVGANVVYENNFEEGVVFANPPSDMFEWMYEWHNERNMPDHPPYDKWDEIDEYLDTPNHYTLSDVRDFSYSDEHNSYRAADKGYPVGDLNWFPELKERWLHGLPASYDCGDITYVQPDNYPEETGTLNRVIEECVAENPETIFVLERDAVYWLDETIIVDEFKFHLRAEEGEGHLPIIRPADTDDHLINSNDDITLENIFMLAFNEGGEPNHQITHDGNDNRITFSGGVMVGTASTSFIIAGSNNSLFVSDATFANGGRLHRDFGRFIDARGNSQDSIWVENSTLYNFVHAILTGTSGIGYLHLNHNTMLNAGSNIRTAAAIETVITNNLFLNLSLRGESGIITASAAWEGRSFNISNNNIGFYDEEHSTLFESESDKAPVLHSVFDPWMQDGVGADVTYTGNIQEDIAFEDPPMGLVAWMEHYNTDPRPPHDSFDLGWAYDRWDAVDPYLGAPRHYTISDLRDFNYSDEHDSYTAAELGYPVGDLNWFPELKEMWEQGLPAPDYVQEEITFANVVSPREGTIEVGEEFTVYARVEVEGISENGETGDIQAWIGYNTSDVAPSASGWTWVEADFNSDYTGNGHEYMAEIGSELTVGTYYYASRFQLKDQAYVYGGYDGGFWDGENNVSGILNVIEDTDAQIVDIPREFGLQQNYPNPFNPVTSIAYQVPKSAHVTIEIYNVVGQRVATLVNETRDAGYHQVTFDATRLASGMYIYRMQAGEFSQTRKLMLTK